MPDQPVVAAATRPVPPANAVVPAPPIMPIVAASVSPPNPTQATAPSSVFGSTHRVSTISVKPDTTIVSKYKLEAAPLPPTKTGTLASAAATTVLARVADPTGSVKPATTKGAEATRAKPSEAGAAAAGASSFLIQLASSQSKSEALATLSRLRKQFPDVLRGGSVRRADLGSNGVFYRVQLGPLSRSAADKVCLQLKASGGSCIVTGT
jgi:hypothetical protein